MLKHLPLAIVLCLLAQSNSAQADAIVATIASWHATNHGGNSGYNEVNPGLGYEHPLNERHTFSLGFYDNSYDRNTDYILDLWQPLQGRSDFGTFKFGLAFGIATGYENDSFSPVAVPMLSYENSTWGLNLITVTFPTPVLLKRSVFALQLKIKLP